MKDLNSSLCGEKNQRHVPTDYVPSFFPGRQRIDTAATLPPGAQACYQCECTGKSCQVCTHFPTHCVKAVDDRRISIY